jgi:5-methylcytosine-specific restriction protein A
MATINKVRLCSRHSFYNTADNPNGCPLCRKESNKVYDTTIRSEERKKIYNSKRWKEVRELAILRDEFQCVECKKLGINTKFEEVDHIVELSDDITLAYNLNNLQCLCKKHHREKTEREKKKR